MSDSEPLPSFEPRLALASLSGEAGLAWAEAGASEAGLAFLGGIALDDPTRAAARQLVAEGRSEFLPPDPIAWIDDQLRRGASLPIELGVNVRAVGREPIARAASVCHDHDAIVEVNAHCRQDSMCRAGAGESLAREPERLASQIRAAAETGATTSVKLRAELDEVDLPALARRVVDAGANVVHVDAMDSEGVIALVTERVPEATVIANNGVRDRPTVREYLACGADAVSLGRPSDDPVVRRRVARAVTEWFDTASPGDGLAERGDDESETSRMTDPEVSP